MFLLLPALLFAEDGDYEKGVAYLKAGSAEDALRLLAPLASKSPDDPYLFYHLGLACYKAGRLDEAMEALKKTRRLAGDRAEEEFKLSAAFSNVGIAFYRQKAYDKALTSFAEASSLDPKDVGSFYYSGLSRIEKGDYEGALADLKKAEALGPEDMATQIAVGNATGMVYAREGHNAEAIAEFEKTLKADPDNTEALYSLGILNYKEYGFNASKPYLDRIAAKGAADEKDKAAMFTSIFNMGIDFQDRDMAPAAAEMFGKAIIIKPDDAEAHYYLGYNLMAMDRYEEAAKELGKSLELKPGMERAKAQLEVAGRFAAKKYLTEAKGLLAKDDFYGALPLFEKALALCPSDKEARKGRSDSAAKVAEDVRIRVRKIKDLLAKAEYLQAALEARELLRLNPLSKTAAELDHETTVKLASLLDEYAEKAKDAENREALGEAVDYYTVILRFNPDNRKVADSMRRDKGKIEDTRQRARKAANEDQLIAAREAYETLVKYVPKDEEAVDGLKDARSRITKEIDRLLGKAKDAISSDDFASAMTYITKVLALSPHNDEAAMLKAKITARTRELVARYVREGEAHLAADRRDKAVESFKAALRLDPDNAAALRGIEMARAVPAAPAPLTAEAEEKVRRMYLSGVEHYTKGELKEAVALWRDVLAVDPANEKAKSSITKAEEKMRQTSQ